jgi:hypothetical protein
MRLYRVRSGSTPTSAMSLLAHIHDEIAAVASCAPHDFSVRQSRHEDKMLMVQRESDSR